MDGCDGMDRLSEEAVEPWQVSAVLVGIEVYQDEGREPLPGAARDALRFAALLRDRDVPAENITVLLHPIPTFRAEAEKQAAELGVTVAPATFEGIRNAFLDLAGTRSRLLFTFWSGHGAMHPDTKKRYLFHSEATEHDARSISVDSLCTLMRQRQYGSLRRQIFLVDACGWFLNHRERVPVDVGFASGSVPRHTMDQFVLFASREGQAAVNHPGYATTEFAQQVLKSLQTAPPVWPPDVDRLTHDVESYFATRTDSVHQQTPVAVYHQTYAGASREFISGLTDDRPDVPEAPPHLQEALGELHEESRRHIDRFSLSQSAAPAGGHTKMINVRYRAVSPVSGVPRESSYDMVRRFYNIVPHGRMVVIGGPGSGKTALAIRLVRELLSQRTPSQPVPVLLTLVNWKRPSRRLTPDGSQSYEHLLLQHFERWLADQLVSQGLCADRSTALDLVRGRWVLPVLDGLDEARVLRSAASPPHPGLTPEAEPLKQLLAAIDRYGSQGLPAPVVVTARNTENDELQTGLSSACVVEMQQLSVPEIQAALRSTVPRYVSDAAWAPVREDLDLGAGSVAAGRLDTPWKLLLAVRAIQAADATVSPGDLVDPGEDVDRALHERLLAAFIPAACQDTFVDAPRWTNHITVTRWLSELARHLDRHQSEDLTLSRLWPMAGPVRVRLTQTLLHVAVVGFFGIACILAAVGGPGHAHSAVRPALRVITGSKHLSGNANRRFWSAFIFASIATAAAAVTGWMRPVWIPAVSRRTRSLRLRLKDRDPSVRLLRACSGIEIGSAVGLAFGLGFFLLFGQVAGIVVTCAVGIPLGYAMEAKVGLDRTLSGNFAPAYYWIWEGLSLSAGAVVGAGVFALVGSAPSAGAAFGGAVGYFGAFAIGLIAWLRYVIAMSIMYLRGRLPWKVAAFLDWAHRVGVLRVHGVSWQFRHAELQAWLSAQPLSPAQRPPRPSSRRRISRLFPSPE